MPGVETSGSSPEGMGLDINEITSGPSMDQLNDSYRKGMMVGFESHGQPINVFIESVTPGNGENQVIIKGRTEKGLVTINYNPEKKTGKVTVERDSNLEALKNQFRSG